MTNSFTELKQQFHYIIFANFSAEEAEFDDVQELIDVAEIPEWLTMKIAPDLAKVKHMASSIFEDKEQISGVNAASLHKALEATHAIVVTGETFDPEDSLDNYIAVVALMDIILQSYSDCVAVLDLTINTITRPNIWLKNVVANLSNDIFETRDHISVITTPEHDHTFWLHTQGMIKFGKPELSLREVTEIELEDNLEFLYDLAAEIIYNDTIPENGATVEFEEIPQLLKAVHMGSYDDKVFGFNVHLELEARPDNEHLH